MTDVRLAVYLPQKVSVFPASVEDQVSAADSREYQPMGTDWFPVAGNVCV